MERALKLILFLLFFHIPIIFASLHQNITIGSHNLHGFKKSSNYHKNCIQKHGGVWFAQELWLQEKQLSQMQHLGVQFSARSGMETAVSSGLLKGRPFGGVSVAWSSDLNHVINPLSNYRHKRVVAVELKTEAENLLLISTYMPFFDASSKEECMAETRDAISMIEVLIENHPHHLINIGGDLNTELKGDSPFDNLWEEMCARNQLAYCSPNFSTPGYTYHQDKLGHKKFLDHFIVNDRRLDARSTPV